MRTQTAATAQPSGLSPAGGENINIVRAIAGAMINAICLIVLSGSALNAALKILIIPHTHHSIIHTMVDMYHRSTYIVIVATAFLSRSVAIR